MNSTIKAALFVFIGFALLVLVLFWTGKKIHQQPGAGLDSSLQQQIIVQYFLKADPKLRVDFRSIKNADVFAYDQKSSLAIDLVNLDTNSKQLKLNLRTEPNIDNYLQPLNIPSFIALAGKEKMQLVLDFYLNRPTELETVDGTVDLFIEISAK